MFGRGWSMHGYITDEATGDVLWRCQHEHRNMDEAVACGRAEAERRQALALDYRG